VSAPLPAELSAVLDAITPVKRTAKRGAAKRLTPKPPSQGGGHTPRGSR